MLRSMNSIKLLNDQYFGELYLEEQKKKKKWKDGAKKTCKFYLEENAWTLSSPRDSAVSQLEIMPDEASFWIWISQFSIRS